MERFRLSAERAVIEIAHDEPPAVPRARPPGITRWVDQRGCISVAGFTYRVGPTFAGEPVEVVCHGGLIKIVHRGCWWPPTPSASGAWTRRRRPELLASLVLVGPPPGPPSFAIADASGNISFAGANY
ncbi:MAG: hypothetical protein M3179_02570 [Actinomycetota bacterium]|nr:hypothetical protein [Actinomycetota bacterium]